MKHRKQVFNKIKVIDIAIAVLLLIALSLSGYAYMEIEREMSDTDVLYIKEENQGINQYDFQTAESG